MYTFITIVLKFVPRRSFTRAVILRSVSHITALAGEPYAHLVVRILRLVSETKGRDHRIMRSMLGRGIGTITVLVWGVLSTV